MSQIEMLRLLITQRLTAAAEEIFGVFGRTIAEYEDEISRSKMEISRQRRLLELSRKPQVCLQDEEQEQEKEEEEEGGSSAQEPRSWSPALRDMEAPPIKKEEEEEELWSARQEERSQEFLFFQSGGVRSEPDDDEDERRRDRTTSPLATLQDPEDSELGPLPGPLPGPSLRQTCSAEDASGPVFGDGRPDAAASSYICTVCGRAFTQRSLWAKHVQVHRAADPRMDKSYTCDICGKRLTRFDGYQKHLRIHTGEKPYTCGACGRRFSDNSNYKRHIRTHAVVLGPACVRGGARESDPPL